VPNQSSFRQSSPGIPSPATLTRRSPLPRSPLPRSPISPVPPSPSTYRYDPKDPEPQTKDLSFLLHPSFYLPLSQSEVPPQFRIQLEPLSPSKPINQSLAEIEKLLSRGQFLAAAHLAAGILTSPALDSTDIKTIADLLSIRYSCLELTGNTLIAAQESKALEDLNSEFYFIIPPSYSSKQSQLETPSPPPTHILPFRLRLQASRLQSIGFSDPRRGVSALYDLGVECRERLTSPGLSDDERELYRQRLMELGARVVNALIEINDLECAKRTLKELRPSDEMEWKMRMGLLLLRVGDTSAAKVLLEDSSNVSPMLASLLATAEGRFEDAVVEWENFEMHNQEPHLKPIIQQNLAVNYLYAGRLEDARRLTEAVVKEGESYRSLIFDLATIYELSSEKSRNLKMDLASRIASQGGTTTKHWAKLNADFKL
jgi:trafficking protein particle complex subunit 12